MSDEGGHRHQRLEQLIAEELAGLLRDEVVDPRLDGVRVSGVELSVDYRSARVRFIVEEGGESRLERIEQGLARATPFLRARLGEALDLKRLPELVFKFDRDAAAGARARELLDEK
jgi:ribosome-binding factor A